MGHCVHPIVVERQARLKRVIETRFGREGCFSRESLVTVERNSSQDADNSEGQISLKLGSCG